MEQELQKESKCSFYALEQLRQTAEAILRGSQRLLKCRAGVEKYRTAQPQRAYVYYLELQKTRNALLTVLGDAQRNLLELEESALAGKAGQLQAGLRHFDLMSRAYKPVYEVLTGFAKSLPQTDTVNAAVIGRLMNHVRMGYYPTDPENIAHILRGIAFPEGVTTNLLDPCCGCGFGASAACRRQQLLHLRHGAGRTPRGGSADKAPSRRLRQLLSQPDQP